MTASNYYEEDSLCRFDQESLFGIVSSNEEIVGHFMNHSETALENQLLSSEANMLTTQGFSKSLVISHQSLLPWLALLSEASTAMLFPDHEERFLYGAEYMTAQMTRPTGLQ